MNNEYEDYIRTKIDKLRIEHKLSERKLSLDLGHGANYINAILNGRALPSMGEFLYLCEFFNITPLEFFESGLDMTKQDIDLVNLIKALDSDTKTHLCAIVKKLGQ